MSQVIYKDSAFRYDSGLPNVELVFPPNTGWLEVDLIDEQIEHLWQCINAKGDLYNDSLAGHIDSSFQMEDIDGRFWNMTLQPLVDCFGEKIGNEGSDLPLNQSHPYFLKSFWVNFQKKHEFNPIHKHTGVYSFVIWLKVPTDTYEQNSLPIGAGRNGSVVSDFEFQYSDTSGKLRGYVYKMDKGMEGKMLLFPSWLKHCVYPYYECDETRISISGNVCVDTTKMFNPRFDPGKDGKQETVQVRTATNKNTDLEFRINDKGNGLQIGDVIQENKTEVIGKREIPFMDGKGIVIKKDEPKEGTREYYLRKNIGAGENHNLNPLELEEHPLKEFREKNNVNRTYAKSEEGMEHMIDEHEYPFWARDNKEMKEWIENEPPFKMIPKACHAHMTDWDAHVRCPAIGRLIDWMKTGLWPGFGYGTPFVNAEVWGVVYNKGQALDWHNHRTSRMSFAYYVNCPEGSSPLMFKDGNISIEPEEGKMIIFDGRMSHKVPPNPCDGRVIISGNLFFN